MTQEPKNTSADVRDLANLAKGTLEAAREMMGLLKLVSAISIATALSVDQMLKWMAEGVHPPAEDLERMRSLITTRVDALENLMETHRAGP